MTQFKAAPPKDSQTSLRTALERAASEAHRIATGLEKIDQDIGCLLLTTNLDAQEWQAADLLRQETEGLSHFLSLLAQQTDAELGCNITAAKNLLKLQAQEMRLTGSSHSIYATSSDELWDDPA